MVGQVAGGYAVAFDLTDLAAELDRATRFSRVMVLIIALAFAIFAAIALWILLFPPAGHAADLPISATLATTAFGLVSLYGWWAYIPLGRAPRRLMINERGIAFEQVPGRRDHVIGWGDPRLRIHIYDLRGLPKLRYDGKPRTILFRMRTRWGSDTAITQDAFDRIVREAEGHGLRVTRREAPYQGPGTRMLVTVSR
jgi:hypothetical protein